jgi:hypothetical protein
MCGMKAAIVRRLALLEAQQDQTAKRIHIIAASDQNDAKGQMADLVAAGLVQNQDGFMCITSKPL